MPVQRQNIYAVPSDAVQGDGSWVKIRAVKYGQSKALRKQIESISEAEKVKVNDQLLIEHIYDWNWVDDDGNPLPIPKDKPEVLDELTAQEIGFLGEAMRGTAEARKKP